MAPKVTPNGNSLQVILPLELCERANIRAGDQLMATGDGRSITLERKKQTSFYTIGYESRTIDNFVSRLKNKGITQLIDVREKPISRKAGFSKKALSERLGQENIKYVHMPSLGSPSDIRHEYKNGGSELVFFQRYESYVREYEMSEVNRLEEYVSREPSAIMCFEFVACHCHRRVLSKMLEEKGYRKVDIRW